MIDRLPSTDEVETFWKLKPVFDGYFSSRDGATEHRWRQESGRPVRGLSWEFGLELFRHRKGQSPKSEWVISEARSGLWIASGGSVGEAIAAARSKLRKEVDRVGDLSLVRMAISNHMVKFGISPRYVKGPAEL